MDKLQKLKQDLEILKAKVTSIQESLSKLSDLTKTVQLPQAEQIKDKIKLKLYTHYILVSAAVIEVQRQIIEELENNNF